ncbi:MAG: hypothetical protein RL311_670 [Bacteroidota bacterium]|jgi:hypothetical protein
MKKISLKNVKETLSRKEMKVISGGYGNYGCQATRCGSGGTCAFWMGPYLSSGCGCFQNNQKIGNC